MTLLTETNRLAEWTLGGTRVRYERCERSGVVEFSCIPESMEGERVAQRPMGVGPHVDGLPEAWRQRHHAHKPEWLAQFKLEESPEPKAFALGMSLRGAPDLDGLCFESQQWVEEESGEIRVETLLRHDRGYGLRHVLAWKEGDPFFRVRTVFENDTDSPLTLDYLPSFSLGQLTPFHPGEAPEQLYLHRFRSVWSAEGRHERLLLEDLNLERSWAGYGVRTERFGQIGSMPVRGFFPWMALEDAAAGVMWGAQLSEPGSWHMELGRRKDKVTLSGGLPSRDFGEWWKTVLPGERFASPDAVIACVRGDVDDLCAALVRAQEAAADRQPEIERELPMVFNEWCTSWGEPTHRDMVDTADRLAGTRTKIMVIDDGWATKPECGGIQFNGDWEVDRRKFPDGLRATTDALGARGFVSGLWFEMEAATRGTRAFERTRHMLHRHGRVIQVGNRRFWDFRHPETIDYLVGKLIRRLRDDGFGYLKIDYNDTLPAGVDGVESPGEELRKHLRGVQDFLRRVQREVPGILIENCSSGGHRLEPGFMGICAMGSFSDAHETLSIPIIAANLHRLVLVRQNQVWCVPHPRDSLQRMRYGLAATFLGRMAVSGEVKALSDAQIHEVARAQAFLEGCRPILLSGRSRLIRDMGKSWNAPRGWQVVSRVSNDQTMAMIVLHSFGLDAPLAPAIPLPPGDWRIADTYGWPEGVEVRGGQLHTPPVPAFSGMAARLVRRQTGTRQHPDQNLSG